MKLTVERTVLVGFVIVLALLGTVGVVSQRTIIGLIDDSKWVTHTYIVLELLQQISFRISQAEAAVRGYVITGDSTFESQYEDIRKQVPDLISEMRTQTLDNPAEQSDINALDTLIQKRFDTMEEGIRVRKSGGLQAVLALGSTSPGRRLSMEISALTVRMRGDEEQLLADRNQRAQLSARELIDHAIEVMRPMAQNQQIQLSGDNSDLLIYADRDRIMQCLTNLLSNAIKFSEPGGTVKVLAKPAEREARFEVSDHGRG